MHSTAMHTLSTNGQSRPHSPRLSSTDNRRQLGHATAPHPTAAAAAAAAAAAVAPPTSAPTTAPSRLLMVILWRDTRPRSPLLSPPINPSRLLLLLLRPLPPTSRPPTAAARPPGPSHVPHACGRRHVMGAADSGCCGRGLPSAALPPDPWTAASGVAQLSIHNVPMLLLHLLVVVVLCILLCRLSRLPACANAQCRDCYCSPVASGLLPRPALAPTVPLPACAALPAPPIPTAVPPAATARPLRVCSSSTAAPLPHAIRLAACEARRVLWGGICWPLHLLQLPGSFSLIPCAAQAPSPPAAPVQAASAALARWVRWWARAARG